jgi:hypothetical protein
VPSAPQILEIFEDNITSITIQVNFEPPTTPNGIITHYLVNYSINDNSTDRNEVSIRFGVVQGRMTYSVELVNLTEFTSYTIEVSAFTRIGEGSVSTRIVVTNPDVASPPTNLVATVINSTAVELTWGYPLFPRGEISGYVISVNGRLEVNQTLEMVNSMSNQSFTVDMLQPFTMYTFSVAAYAFHRGAVIIGAVSERTDTTLEAGELQSHIIITFCFISQIATYLQFVHTCTCTGPIGSYYDLNHNYSCLLVQYVKYMYSA